MALEESLKAMQEQDTCRNCNAEEQSGTYVRGKYKMTRASETLHRHRCCLICIVVLTMFIPTLSVTLAVLVRKERPVTEVHVYTTCPPQWIGVGNKCFYFSDDTANWTFSQNFCKSLEGDLVQIGTTAEMKFLKRYKGPHDHWIGLSRESSSHPWKWTNSTGNHIGFKVRGTGECAYLNDNGVSSGRVYADRKWICSKPNSHVHSCQNISDS